MCQKGASTSFEHGNIGSIEEKSEKNINMTKSSNSHRVREDSTGSSDDSSSVEMGFEMDPAMKTEVDAAVGFLTDFLVKAPKQEFSQESVDLFRRSLQSILCHHYIGHWHAANPLKGSGFRCLRINGKLDPLIKRAAEASRLPLLKVRQAFPAELTVWVDPFEVSVRYGEEGSVGVWYASRRSGEEDEHRQKKDHQKNQAFVHQMYQRSSPILSSTPPNVHGFQQHHSRVQYQASPIQHQHQRQHQSSPVWSAGHWNQQQTPVTFSPHQNRSSPSSFVTSSADNGFLMALNHQQQQMQQRQQHAPFRFNRCVTPPSHAPWGTSPQPQSTSETGMVENGEEQRCKMLAERLMRENLNLMASLAPGLVSSRPQAVGVGVN